VPIRESPMKPQSDRLRERGGGYMAGGARCVRRRPDAVSMPGVVWQA
jgi:hypothetical protein